VDWEIERLMGSGRWVGCHGVWCVGKWDKGARSDGPRLVDGFLGSGSRSKREGHDVLSSVAASISAFAAALDWGPT
jgi:hypothetical protein